MKSFFTLFILIVVVIVVFTALSQYGPINDMFTAQGEDPQAVYTNVIIGVVLLFITLFALTAYRGRR